MIEFPIYKIEDRNIKTIEILILESSILQIALRGRWYALSLLPSLSETDALRNPQRQLTSDR